MEIRSSTNPAKECGEHISSLIKEAGSDVVVLLSGGSALDVFEHVQIADKSECRTIFMMVDERVSGETKTNNYLQLKDRYAKHPLFADIIDTRARENENPESYAQRIKNAFIQKISELHSQKVFCLLGVGTDGHTAGIFPLNQESFTNVYEADSTYVPVHLESLTIHSRASFTPQWLLNKCDAVIGYVVGESKFMILESLKNESKPIHERPAEILKLHKNSTIYTDMPL